jgi:hypothetical protein
MPGDEDLRAAYDALVAWGRARRAIDTSTWFCSAEDDAWRALRALADRLAEKADDDARGGNGE